MSKEREQALILANRVLELCNDPDEEMAILARQLLRAQEQLNWYGEKAESLSVKDWKKNPDYALAIFTELSLDAGRRSK